jgi:hypothetical protein
MATETGGSIVDASPVLAIGLIECLRTPVAMRIPQLKLGGALCALALCIGITPLTGEAMMLAADRLFHARTHNVYEAEEARDAAKAKFDASRDESDARNTAIADARRHLEEIQSHAPIPPSASGCVAKGTYKTKKGGTQSYTGSCAADNLNAETFSKAQAAFNAEVAKAQAAVASAEAAAPVDVKALEAALKGADTKVIMAKDESTMHRAAAAWFGVSVAALADEQYEKFARICMIGIAASVSVTTMFSAFISNLPTKDGRAGKLVNAIRRRLAAKRKTLRKLVPTYITEFRDRVKYVHVPVDSATGTILADVPPEARFGDNVVNLKSAAE